MFLDARYSTDVAMVHKDATITIGLVREGLSAIFSGVGPRSQVGAR